MWPSRSRAQLAYPGEDLDQAPECETGRRWDRRVPKECDRCSRDDPVRPGVHGPFVVATGDWCGQTERAGLGGPVNATAQCDESIRFLDVGSIDSEYQGSFEHSRIPGRHCCRETARGLAELFLGEVDAFDAPGHQVQNVLDRHLWYYVKHEPRYCDRAHIGGRANPIAVRAGHQTEAGACHGLKLSWVVSSGHRNGG